MPFFSNSTEHWKDGKIFITDLCIIVHHCASIIIHPHESANGGTFLSSQPRAKLCERSSRPFSVQRQKTCVQAIAMANGTGTVRHD